MGLRRKDKEDANVLTRRTKGEKVLFGVVFVIFVIYSLILLYPLLFLLINSFQDALVYVISRTKPGYNPFALPSVWHFENYSKVLDMYIVDSFGGKIYLTEMIWNSIWYCIFKVAGPVLMSCCTGYVLSKYRFKGGEIIYALAIFSMMIPILGTQASSLKLYHQMGIYNTPAGVLLTSLSGWGFNFMVMYGFFKNVSWHYAEAVFLDGGGSFTAFFKAMLPQAKMAIVTLSVISFITAWNDYETLLIFYPDYPTFASGLYRLKLTATRSGDIPYYYAGLIISLVPLIAVYASCSDIIFKNFSVGGLKG